MRRLVEIKKRRVHVIPIHMTVHMSKEVIPQDRLVGRRTAASGAKLFVLVVFLSLSQVQWKINILG